MELIFISFPCWWFSLFSAPDCLRLYWHCKGKLDVDHKTPKCFPYLCSPENRANSLNRVDIERQIQRTDLFTQSIVHLNHSLSFFITCSTVTRCTMCLQYTVQLIRNKSQQCWINTTVSTKKNWVLINFPHASGSVKGGFRGGGWRRWRVEGGKMFNNSPTDSSSLCHAVAGPNHRLKNRTIFKSAQLRFLTPKCTERWSLPGQKNNNKWKCVMCSLGTNLFLWEEEKNFNQTWRFFPTLKFTKDIFQQTQYPKVKRTFSVFLLPFWQLSNPPQPLPTKRSIPYELKAK